MSKVILCLESMLWRNIRKQVLLSSHFSIYWFIGRVLLSTTANRLTKSQSAWQSLFNCFIARIKMSWIEFSCCPVTGLTGNNNPWRHFIIWVFAWLPSLHCFVAYLSDPCRRPLQLKWHMPRCETPNFCSYRKKLKCNASGWGYWGGCLFTY